MRPTPASQVFFFPVGFFQPCTKLSLRRSISHVSFFVFLCAKKNTQMKRHSFSASFPAEKSEIHFLSVFSAGVLQAVFSWALPAIFFVALGRCPNPLSPLFFPHQCFFGQFCSPNDERHVKKNMIKGLRSGSLFFLVRTVSVSKTLQKKLQFFFAFKPSKTR